MKASVQDLQAGERTLRPNDETTGEEREAQGILRRQAWESSADPMHQHFAKMMRSFEPGVFVGGESADFPTDNLALITASATLYPFSLGHGSSWRTEGSRGERD